MFKNHPIVLKNHPIVEWENPPDEDDDDDANDDQISITSHLQQQNEDNPFLQQQQQENNEEQQGENNDFGQQQNAEEFNIGEDDLELEAELNPENWGGLSSAGLQPFINIVGQQMRQNEKMMKMMIKQQQQDKIFQLYLDKENKKVDLGETKIEIFSSSSRNSNLTRYHRYNRVTTFFIIKRILSDCFLVQLFL